jgi:hypothetical protein
VGAGFLNVVAMHRLCPTHVKPPPPPPPIAPPLPSQTFFFRDFLRLPRYTGFKPLALQNIGSIFLNNTNGRAFLGTKSSNSSRLAAAAPHRLFLLDPYGNRQTTDFVF